jgi:hypothetical protein
MQFCLSFENAGGCRAFEGSQVDQLKRRHSCLQAQLAILEKIQANVQEQSCGISCKFVVTGAAKVWGHTVSLYAAGRLNAMSIACFWHFDFSAFLDWHYSMALKRSLSIRCAGLQSAY